MHAHRRLGAARSGLCSCLLDLAKQVSRQCLSCPENHRRSRERRTKCEWDTFKVQHVCANTRLGENRPAACHAPPTGTPEAQREWQADQRTLRSSGAETVVTKEQVLKPTQFVGSAWQAYTISQLEHSKYHSTGRV